MAIIKERREMNGMNPKRLLLLAIFNAGILATGLAPAALAADKPAAKPQATRADTANPKIAPGDVVSITIYPADEYNREVTVQPDGKIELALIGSLVVKDLTAKELQDLLEVRYAKYVDSPKVSVATRHFAGRRVAIIGEVHTPNFYEYRDGMKMLELISLAGGLSDNARASHVVVLREGLPEGFSFNFQAVLDGQLSRDIPILPGDTIYVPKTPLNKKSTWISNNIVPWLSLAALGVSLALLARQQ